MNKNKEKKRELTHFLGHFLEMHYSLPYFQHPNQLILFVYDLYMRLRSNAPLSCGVFADVYNNKV